MEPALIALPVTTMTVGILGVLAVLLSINVIRHRGRSQISLDPTPDPGLHVAVRIFGNFTEYVPIALIVLAVAEINKTGTTILWVISGLIVVGRLIHIFGLKVDKPLTIARVVGILFSWVSIGLGSVMCLIAAFG